MFSSFFCHTLFSFPPSNNSIQISSFICFPLFTLPFLVPFSLLTWIFKILSNQTQSKLKHGFLICLLDSCFQKKKKINNQLIYLFFYIQILDFSFYTLLVLGWIPKILLDHVQRNRSCGIISSFSRIAWYLKIWWTFLRFGWSAHLVTAVFDSL